MAVLRGMKKILLLGYIVCLFIVFFIGRRTSQEKVIEKNILGKTIRDTITRFVSDTVYLAGELKYKYVYVQDTIYKDVPVVDREATIVETVRDWNKIREYNKLLFDNENGKLSLNLSVQYNELQRLAYSFTPVHRAITIVKKRVFEPFVSASFHVNYMFSAGGGFFYYDFGFRAEWAITGLNFGVLYKF